MKTLATALMFLAVSCTSNATYGDVLIQSIETENVYDFGNSGTIGYSFRTHEAVRVHSLGMWDYQLDGFSSDIDVGLFDDSGSLLRSVRLHQGVASELENGFRYESNFAPFTLQANSIYVLGAFRRPGVEYNIGMEAGQEFFHSPLFAILEERADSLNGGAASLAFPGIADQANAGLIGPNMKFTAVPEPGSAAVFGSVFMAMLRRRRKPA